MTTKTAKTVLITGASTGFGRDTAETLKREGHQVFASLRDIAGRNHLHAEALRAQEIKVVELDVSDTHSVKSAVNNVLFRTGRIDVLVNLLSC
jgi:NADP-dependent 3-hydroxy acid dehydrogenase YdfG